MFIRFIFLTATLLLANSIKIFLFGGILNYDGNPAYQQLVKQAARNPHPDCDDNWDLTDCPRVAVITSACPDSACGDQEYYDGDGDEEAPTAQFFQRLGMTTKHIKVHIDNYRQSTSVFTELGFQHYKLLSQADVIYFNGGDQSRHARCWLLDNGQPNLLFSVIKARALNNEIILVGVSAGTAIHSKITYGGGSPFGILYFINSVGLAPNKVADGEGEHGLQDMRNGTDCLQYSQNGAKLEGFGTQLQFQIDTHFDRRGRLGRLVPVLSHLKSTLGIGIDEETCFYYKDGVGKVFGNHGVFIVDTSNAVKLQSQYFQIKNVKVHYLSDGDSFDFKGRSVISSKPLISTPKYDGFQDSKSILSRYECTRLITRLVDQKGIYNLGKTTIPQDQDYPSDTPTFDFMFYKSSETKGYRANNAYTAVNVNLDISSQTRRKGEHKYLQE